MRIAECPLLALLTPCLVCMDLQLEVGRYVIWKAPIGQTRRRQQRVSWQDLDIAVTAMSLHVGLVRSQESLRRIQNVTGLAMSRAAGSDWCQ